MLASMEEVAGLWNREQRITRRAIGALPDGGHSYRPCERSRAAGEVAWHIVSAPLWLLGRLLSRPLHEGWVLRWPQAPARTQEMLEALDARHEICLEAIRSCGDAWLAQSSGALGGGRSNGALLTDVLFHEAHHRGQLSVYLRAMGAAVPAIYGPSADDR